MTSQNSSSRWSDAGMTEEVYSLHITYGLLTICLETHSWLWWIHNMPWLRNTDTLELQDLRTLKRTITAWKPVWKQRKSVMRRNQKWMPLWDSGGLPDKVLECKRLGCETQWVRLCSIWEKLQVTHSPTSQYHLRCISLEIVSWNWVCEACEACRGTKQSRWWHHITIYGHVPDYVGR